ncbi:hypothetical protein [Glycomyces sp. NPDC047010]|uniref:hypothetical protein n=1 Tax=Glycomyces sp. NPDC047010 TaxID=3155023 RepID=UPI0033DAC559
MPKDDATFTSDLDAVREKFQEASEKNMREAYGFMLRDQFESQMNRVQSGLRFVNEIGSISGGTAIVTDALELQVLPRLKEYELSNNEGPVQIVRGKLEEWHGPEGSASYQFKWAYLPQLATALENQLAAMQSMAAIMTSYEAVLDQVRQKTLDILKEATKAIDDNTEQVEQASSVAAMVTAVVTGLAGGATVGGPKAPFAAAVFGALGAVGVKLDAVATATEGDNWFDITGDMLEKLQDVATATKEEAGVLASALDEVLNYAAGDFSSEFVPPAVLSTGVSAAAFDGFAG